MHLRQSNVANLAALVILHAAGAGLALPSILATRPAARVGEWLPRDNQTVYKIEGGKTRRLELNTSSITESPVYISVSPCTGDVHWAIYRGVVRDGHYNYIEERSGVGTSTISLAVIRHERIILQLSSAIGGAAAVSVRGEKPKHSRLRLRVRSRRRLVVFWEPSPIDPQSTSYCVVASRKRNYTSLCSAKCDLKTSSPHVYYDIGKIMKNATAPEVENEESNSVEISDNFNAYAWDTKHMYKRRKSSRSTKVSENDPVIACVGDRTHHLIENLDPATMYFVSVFAVAQDRQAGALLATGTVRRKTMVARRLKENVPFRSEVRGKTVLYYKASVSPGGGVWLTANVCGGPLDFEVFLKGKRLQVVRNIEHSKNFFVPASISFASLQETSDEGSVQFDSSSSSSEESRVKFVVKVTPSLKDRDGVIGLELTAKTSKSPPQLPEPSEEASTVRELRPSRTCRSVEVAFLPILQVRSDFIRYCISARESQPGTIRACTSYKDMGRMQCLNHSHRIQSKVIVHKINNLKPGKKYEVQVTASDGENSVSYKILHVSTSVVCT